VNSSEMSMEGGTRYSFYRCTRSRRMGDAITYIFSSLEDPQPLLKNLVG
jgi:hypothetical protein